MKRRIAENFKKCVKNSKYIAMAGVYITLATFGVVCMLAGLAV